MGGTWIETSSDVYFRERNGDKKVFKNIEIWALIPVPVDGAVSVAVSVTVSVAVLVTVFVAVSVEQKIPSPGQ